MAGTSLNASSPLISAAELQALLAAARDGGAAPRLLDVRWRLGADDGRAQYAAGHIPGAVFVDLERDLSQHGSPADGRHPLPDDAALEAAARRWGLRAGEAVVIYDDALSMPAGRAWWALTRAGVADVRVLDGGLSAWRAAGGELETGEVVPEPGDAVLGRPGDSGILRTEDVPAWSGALLDARAPERYRGEVEPVDPIPGHIPGAVNLPGAALLDDEGRFLAPDEIAARFDAAGAPEGEPIAAYCGSGVTASQVALAGAVIGRDVVLYPGSWSAWSNTPGLPVATGAQPG